MVGTKKSRSSGERSEGEDLEDLSGPGDEMSGSATGAYSA